MEMSHLIKGRTPFLDHKLTKYVNELPPSVKLRHIIPETRKRSSTMPDPLGQFTSKWILRKAARSFITDEIYRQQKKAYLAPGTFQKGGPIHRLLKKLLTEANLERYVGFLDFRAIVRLIDEAFPKKGPFWWTEVRQLYPSCNVYGSWEAIQSCCCRAREAAVTRGGRKEAKLASVTS